MILGHLFPGNDPIYETLRCAVILRMVCNRSGIEVPSNTSDIYRAFYEAYPEDGYSYVARAVVLLNEKGPKSAYEELMNGLSKKTNEREEIQLAKEKLMASHPELHLIELQINLGKSG